jgi:hypothetical protein
VNKLLALAAGGLAVVTAAVYAIVFFSGPAGLRPPAELARIALHGADSREKEQAALDLERSKEPARVHLRTVLAETNDPDIRAIAIRGLQSLKDWYSMPKLLDALDDKSEQVRMMAYGAVSELLGETYRYKFDDLPEQRARSIKVMRRAYDVMNKNPPSHYRSTP